MIWTTNPFFIDTAERQRRTAVRAALADDTVASSPVAKHHEIFAQQPKWLDRLAVGEFTGTCNRHPVPPQQFASRRSGSDSGERFVFFACQHSFLRLQFQSSIFSIVDKSLEL
jgi:hypothetical protein